MDSHSNSPLQDNIESKAAFQKPTADAENRKYRLCSPISGSSDSDGSLNRERSFSPVSLREEVKMSNYQSRKDEREDARGFDRNQHSRSNDSSRYSSKSSRGHSRHDDHSSHGKHADDDDRNYSMLSSRSGREHRGSGHSDYKERESDYHRSRDHHRDVGKYPRDKSDGVGHANRDKERGIPSQDSKKCRYKDSSPDRMGSDRSHCKLSAKKNSYYDHDRHARDGENRDDKKEYGRSSRDHRSYHTTSYEESRGHRGDATSKRDHLKEAYKDEAKDLDGREKNNKYDEQDIKRNKDTCSLGGKMFEEGSVFVSEMGESATKRPKLSYLDKDTDQTKKGSSKLFTVEKAPVNVSESTANVDAAKVAAMKAAEFVNKNLNCTGFMTADQKKKLLWGNKKNNSSEEPSHRWDTALFSDVERQEKFNKLMGVKGDVKVEQRQPNDQDGGDLLQAQKLRELQLDLEKQYTAGLRRRDGRTVGLGL
ncbi:hypothetical protein Nepgr_009959 [Nepenthes gracilis]|uniref:Small acidic protein-like domain-containing protein n=1 Tax=Nepenthes gracilis TaxID=150966 RepID=A0AAD3SCD9_NEPGR|nr:hypothetical protein Nepgr_009959 [Nepenthes gracilis]